MDSITLLIVQKFERTPTQNIIYKLLAQCIFRRKHSHIFSQQYIYFTTLNVANRVSYQLKKMKIYPRKIYKTVSWIWET